MSRTPPAGDSPSGAAPFSGRERRREHRRLMQARARLEVLDGPGAGSVHEVQTRDLSLSGIAFLLPRSLDLGQTCRIGMPGAVLTCRVVRVRPLSNGKFEVAVQVREAT